GGIWNSGTLVISNSTISGNMALGYSSGDYVVDPYGGGIYNRGTLSLSNCTIRGNSTLVADDFGRLLSFGSGRGIANDGTLSVNNCTISTNHAGIDYGSGGGLATGGIFLGSNYFPGSATITDSTIFGNSAGSGSGISNGSTLTVSNSTISGNFGSVDPTG